MAPIYPASLAVLRRLLRSQSGALAADRAILDARRDGHPLVHPGSAAQRRATLN